MSHICIKPNTKHSAVNYMEDFINSFYGQSLTRRNHYDYPVYHVEESEKDYQLSIELPGYEANEIDVKIEKDTIILNSASPSEATSDTHKRSFTRHFTIPKDVNQELISAHYKNGLLKLALPKKEEAAPIKIKIN
ncbi:MAG: Hsp20/alpha crystallin family protein [Spirochaetales bacterium]|nr:Hsp20/alpha crystallin family protein [Spirochaetales bacterium]